MRITIDKKHWLTSENPVATAIQEQTNLTGIYLDEAFSYDGLMWVHCNEAPQITALDIELINALDKWERLGQRPNQDFILDLIR